MPVLGFYNREERYTYAHMNDERQEFTKRGINVAQNPINYGKTLCLGILNRLEAI